MERWKRKWRSSRTDLIKRRLGVSSYGCYNTCGENAGGDATIALLTIPLGLYMVFGKSMDEFY